MIREISVEEIDNLESLIHIYLEHKKEDFVTLETVKKQMHSGIEKENHQILCEYDSKDRAKGFLVLNQKAKRFPIVFGNWDFRVEKNLLDYAFNKLSTTSSYIILESGYPTPWISEQLSEHAISLGFVKHDRVYMRLEPIDLDALPELPISADLEYINFTETMTEEVSKLVFKCVDRTVDQELFPSVYGTIKSTTKFHQQLLSGDFGTHKPWYSWILYSGKDYIGASFHTTWGDDTGGVMHIVIDPDYRQKGLGRSLLTHSLRSLLKADSNLTKVELAVTLDNPAKLLYDSLGFKVLNKFSTYLWKR